MTDKDSCIDDNDPTFLTTVGVTLLVVQATERAVGKSMYMIFGLQDMLSVEALERLDHESRRKTLGRLIASVRERVPLDPHFEQVLSTFVEDRNVFVHHLGDRFDLTTSDGQAAAAPLIGRLLRYGTVLMETFAAFMLAFARRVGVDLGGMDAMPGFDDSRRVWGLVSGPLRARILPPEFDELPMGSEVVRTE